jgi:cell division protein FtsZ
VDFADVRAVMADAGSALMGIGVGSGKSRAREAALTAISSPLLESSSIEGAKGVVLNITGGSDLTLHEVNAAAETVYEVVDPNANIIFGAVIDERLQGEIRITVIATGFSLEPQTVAPRTTVTTPQKRFSMPSASPPPPPPAPEPSQPKPPGLDIPEFLQRRRPPR